MRVSLAEVMLEHSAHRLEIARIAPVHETLASSICPGRRDKSFEDSVAAFAGIIYNGFPWFQKEDTDAQSS